MRKQKGQSGRQLLRYSIGLLITVVVVAQVALPVVTDAFVLDTKTVTNETVASGGSAPDVFTVGTVEDGLVTDSDTLWFKDSFDGSTTLVPAANYTVDYGTGEFNVTEADFDGDGSVEVNSTSDQYNVTYDYKPTGYITSSAGRTVLGFVALMLALSLLVVAFRPLLRRFA